MSTLTVINTREDLIERTVMTEQPTEIETPPSIRYPGWWMLPTVLLIILSIALVYAHGEETVTDGSPSVEVDSGPSPPILPRQTP